MKYKTHSRRLFFIPLLLLAITFLIKTPAKAETLSNPRVSANNVVTWDLVKFGNFYQSNTTTKEPIVWRVLSVNGNDVFLLSDLILDHRPYSNNDNPAKWKGCDLRSWLNNEFMNEAFSETEKASIKETVNQNADYNSRNAISESGGPDTNDYIFCLSADDVENRAYGFLSDKGKYSSELKSYLYSTRQTSATNYAVSKGVSVVEGYSRWWLRDVGSGLQRQFIYFAGGISHVSYQTEKIGVRPAMHVDKSIANLVYAGTKTVGEEPQPSKEESEDKSSDESGDSDTPSSSTPDGKSSSYAVGAFSYTVTNNTAIIAAPKSKTAKAVTIPATVKINGKSVPVTTIAPNAFKGMKKLTSVTIGKNVKKIGKNAFNGCKKLKKVTFKTTKLTAKTVGAGAFKGINKKAVFKCPKSKKAAYKKILLKKGAKKTMSFK